MPVCLFFSLNGCLGQDNQQEEGWSNDALQMPEGIKASSLPAPDSEGAHLTASYCSQCHGIPSPASHSAQDWVPVFRRMVLRMERSRQMGNMMGGGMNNMMGGNTRMGMGMRNAKVPTEAEQTIMLDYLQAHALKAISPQELPDANSEGALLFKQKCSRCHALPSPALHTSAEWPEIINRMQLHMKITHIPELSDTQEAEIKSYLQNNAKE